MEPVLLALSTFRKSEALVKSTIELARSEGRPLLVAYVVDVNLARYLIALDIPAGTDLRQACEDELLEDYRREADAHVARIAEMARDAGVPCEHVVVTGRFGIEIIKLIRERPPAKVTLTRSRRPQWVLQLFGSPVDYVIEHADCPVLEDYGVEPEVKQHEEMPSNWWKALFSLRRSEGGIRWGIVAIALCFFLFMVLASPPAGLVNLVQEKAPIGYQLQNGTTTIAESVSHILRADLTPVQVAHKAMVMVAILFTAALLWATEAIPLGATDLLIGALLYLFHILPLDAISKAYMKDAVFFIFGVLAIAAGVAQTGLDRRVGVLLLGKIKGLKTFCFVFLPLLAVSAGFLSEHALVAILIPVLLRTYRLICDANGVRQDRALAVLMLLGVCFAANHGGPGSPAAGGRNAVMVGYLKDYNMPISFAQWMVYAMPYVLVMALCVGAYMYVVFRRKLVVTDTRFGDFIRKEAGTVPRMGKREAGMAMILGLVVILWIAGSKRFGLGGPCIFAVVLMLIFNIVQWKDIQSKVRFEVVGLYAAACAMGVGLKMTGASVWLARSVIGSLPESMQQGNPLIVTTSLFTGTLTNFMSDGATVAAIGPVVLSMAAVAGIHMWKLGLACAFSSSFANMLIVGTPNNAIAYAAGTDPRSGERLLTLRDFMVHGLPMTLLAWGVLWLWTFLGYWRWLSWPAG